MKIIHCADLHLDSAMDTHLSADKARKRRIELLECFSRMLDYAAANDVEAIIIAGDLFDHGNISRETADFLRGEMDDNPDIDFFYLKGNHDVSQAVDFSKLHNVHFFSEKMCSFRLRGNITVSGMEIGKKGLDDIDGSLCFGEKDFNILTLHGMVSDYSVKEAYNINIHKLANRNIDYLALGHIHSYVEYGIDERGTACYPGCLESRGFDETGEHGFVLLDIDETTHLYTRSLIDISKRRAHCIRVDVAGCDNDFEIIKRIDSALACNGCGENDMVKLVLCGELSLEINCNEEYIRGRYGDAYFLFVLKNEIRASFDVDLLAKEQSMRGEFVRIVLSDSSIPKEECMEIIRCGINAMNGIV